MSVVLSHHNAFGTSATSSIVILAVFFPFTITCIALSIIILLSANLSRHNSTETSATSIYYHPSCLISFPNHWYCCIYHSAAVIEALLIFSLLGIADYISLVLSHHNSTGTSATSSIIILAVLFLFTITGIAVFIILQPSLKLY